MKATPRDGTTVRLFVLNGGAGWDFNAGTAWTRRGTSFRILYRLEVPDFVLGFVFLFVCLVLHVSFHCFVVSVV